MTWRTTSLPPCQALFLRRKDLRVHRLRCRQQIRLQQAVLSLRIAHQHIAPFSPQQATTRRHSADFMSSRCRHKRPRTVSICSRDFYPSRRGHRHDFRSTLFLPAPTLFQPAPTPFHTVPTLFQPAPTLFSPAPTLFHTAPTIVRTLSAPIHVRACRQPSGFIHHRAMQ